MEWQEVAVDNRQSSRYAGGAGDVTKEPNKRRRGRAGRITNCNSVLEVERAVVSRLLGMKLQLNQFSTVGFWKEYYLKPVYVWNWQSSGILLRVVIETTIEVKTVFFLHDWKFVVTRFHKMEDEYKNCLDKDVSEKQTPVFLSAFKIDLHFWIYRVAQDWCILVLDRPHPSCLSFIVYVQECTIDLS